jgi:hypothetical protein
MVSDENPGYILRVSTDDWVEQIFEIKKYYSGIMRNWKRGTPILLAKKTDVGDSFLGYGITDKVEMLWEMTPEEENYCRENNWRCALTLKPLIRFKNPYPMKGTFLADDPRKGSFLHGAMLMERQVDEILEQAEDYQE